MNAGKLLFAQFSSRRLEKRLVENIGCRVLAALRSGLLRRTPGSSFAHSAVLALLGQVVDDVPACRKELGIIRVLRIDPILGR